MPEINLPFSIPLTLPVIFAAVQILLDLVLILIVLFLLKKISSFDPNRLEALIDTLKESRRLCDQLGRTVSENAEIAGNIERLMERSSVRSSAQSTVPPDSGSTASRHEQVLMLWRTGTPVDEIADLTGLGRGEVEVMISLADQGSGSS